MPKSRSAIARQLLELQHAIAPTLLKIDGYKEELRDACAEAGAGFTEEVAGLGSVEVKVGSDKKFKGIIPQLVPEAFLALSSARQDKLKADKLVVMAEQYTNARSASVTVRL